VIVIALAFLVCTVLGVRALVRKYDLGKPDVERKRETMITGDDSHGHGRR
jgi:hypothetical protein